MLKRRKYCLLMITEGLHSTEATTEHTLGKTFECELLEVCRTLENWRAKVKASVRPDPTDFPDPEWKSIGWGLVFYTLGGAAIFLSSWLKLTAVTEIYIALT